MVLGRRSAKVAPKRVLSAQTRFGALRTRKNVGHVCKSAAWVILERKELQRRHLSDLERLDRSEPPKTSDTYAKVRKWIFVTLFSFFEKIKMLQKVTFAFWHTCTTFFGVLRGQNRKVASFAFWSTLALPNRPSRTFSYVYDVFACSESPKSTFGALGLFGAVRIATGVRWVGERMMEN